MNARIDAVRPELPTPVTSHRDGLLATLKREHSFEPLRVDGVIPPELDGTLYRVGPAVFEAQGRPYGHMFEADGAVCGIRFSGGGATGAHRIVRTRELEEECAAGKPLYGSAASWPRRLANGLRLRVKNSANTNVLHWQDRLFALFEMGYPTELSRELETMGETDFDGAVPKTFSAHYHRVASQDVIYNFGVRPGPRSYLDLFRLDASGDATRLASLPLRRPMMLHDFIATERYLVFFVSPSELQVQRALFGLNPLTKLVKWQPSHGTEVIVVPLANPTQPTRFTVDAFYQWHFSNAFEKRGELFVDFVRYEDLATFTELGDGIRQIEGGKLTRARVDLSKKRLQFEPLDDVSSEFPRMDPRFEGGAYERMWLFQGTTLSQHDLEQGDKRVHDFGEGHFVSEPVFVPRSEDADEGDGWVLTLVYDDAADQSFVAIIDTARFDDEPVAKVWFDHHVPVTFHGTWAPAS